MIGQCVSLMGTWMQRTALVWLVYTLTDSPFYVGLIGVAQFLPMMFFTLFAGTIVDRFPKRRIILVTQSLFIAQALALALLAASGSARYWMLLLLCAMLGLTTTIDMPARFSYFVEMVGRKDVMNAVSLNSSVVNLARIAGPALAGVVMLRFGAAACFFLNALSFLAVIYSLTRITAEGTPQPQAERKIFSEMADGVRYIAGNETLRIDALFLAVLCTFGMNTEVIVPVFAKTVLGLGAGAYTGLLSAAGFGSLLGAMTMAAAARGGLRKGVFLMGAAASVTVQMLMIFIWFTKSYFAALTMVALIGYSNLVFLNSGNSIFQLGAPSQYRGRVMSVYSFLTQGSTPVGNFFAGSVMQLLGGWAGFPVCGAAALLCLLPFIRRDRKTLEGWMKE